MAAAGTIGITVDPDYDDHDSTYEGASADESETTTVSSSIFSFTYANGRRYHSDRFKGQYFLPNDEIEQDRLDLYHHIYLSLLGGRLHLAPLKSPQRILDVGTGTGIWAIDMADENPQAEIIGTDISPIQPTWVPPNCRFEVDDMEEEWVYPRDYFDYIHMRSLCGCFKDWESMLRKAYKHTKPGGYFEFQDYGGEVFDSEGTKLTEELEHTHSPVAMYYHYVNKAAVKDGRPLSMALRIKQLMETVGFVDVSECREMLPVGDWPEDPNLKEIGRWGGVGTIDSLYPFAVGLLTRVEGWNVQKVQELCDNVKKDLGRGGGKYYSQVWFIYGRRPEAE